MYTAANFGTSKVRDALEGLKGMHSWHEGMTIEEANATLDKIIPALYVDANSPKIVVNRTMYGTEENPDVLSRFQFVIRPSVSNNLMTDTRRTYILDAGEDFFDAFTENAIQWLENYYYYFMLESNVHELNSKVAAISEREGIPFEVVFGVGTDFQDVTDGKAVVGLTADTIMSLGLLPLFDTDIEGRAESYEGFIVATLKACDHPYDIVKVKTQFTKDLHIYSRRTMVKLMRDVYNRDLKYTRVGKGYVDNKDEGYFAVVSKVAMTEAEAAEAVGGIVVENEKASSAETKLGQTKIHVTYLVAPFNTESGEKLDVALESLI